ncbi:hypothetical protein ES708_08754 [subsurface metagenome]
MYWQNRYHKEGAVFDSLTGLETIDLPNKGLLSGVELRVWGACGDDATKPDVWLHDRLKKIELIVNGSKVVKSLTGEQLLADMLYKKTPHYSHDMKNMNAASCEEFFYINLGRHYHDIDYMLDLGKVTDPEIRIDHNFALAKQNGWDYGVAMTTEPSYSVVLHILREPPAAPKGYIKTSELYRFTGGISKKENMMVPRGPMYSNLYVQSWYLAQGLGYLLDKLELNINSDDIIPFRVGPTELAAEIARQYGLFQMSQQVTLTGQQAYPFPLEQAVILFYHNDLVAYVPQYLDIWGNAGKAGFKDIATGLTPYTGQVNMAFTLSGIWPFSVSPIPYFNPMDERTWIDSSKLGDLWVRFEGNASMSTDVVVKLLGDEVVTKYET